MMEWPEKTSKKFFYGTLNREKLNCLSVQVS